MSNTIRIRTTPNGGDNYLNVNLEQDFDFIEDQTDIKYLKDITEDLKEINTMIHNLNRKIML